MIVVNAGNLYVDADSDEALASYLQLTDYFLKVQPEIPIVVNRFRTKQMIEALDRADTSLLTFLEMVLKTIDSRRNNKNDTH